MISTVIGKATLYNADCMEYMATLPDKAFDLAIVDPPYAVGAYDGSFGRGGKKAIARTGLAVAGNRKELHKYANASSAPDAAYFSELFRVSENQIIWGANYYPQYLTHSGWIVWDKKKTDGLLSEGELAFQSLNKTVKFLRHEWEGFRKGAGSFENGENKTIHPNQKPLRLYEWLLTNYAKPGQRILDTHLGSMSSVIACNNLGFEMVGMELDGDYYDSGCERAKNALRQIRMFD